MIKVSADDSLLRFEVSDNGPGIPEKEQAILLLDEDSARRRGVGLRNVNERLRVVYGSNYQLQLDSLPGEGTCVRIAIPELSEGARKTA